jgi:PTS system mannose-specific IIA component
MNRRPPQIMQLGMAGQDDPSTPCPWRAACSKLVDSGDGRADPHRHLGATPANTAAKLLEPGRVEGVAGVNLPMLLRVITYRERSMDVLVKKAVAGACEGVVHMKYKKPTHAGDPGKHNGSRTGLMPYHIEEDRKNEPMPRQEAKSSTSWASTPAPPPN